MVVMGSSLLAIVRGAVIYRAAKPKQVWSLGHELIILAGPRCVWKGDAPGGRLSRYLMVPASRSDAADAPSRRNAEGHGIFPPLRRHFDAHDARHRIASRSWQDAENSHVAAHKDYE